jgi:hypothetical protein
MPIPTEKERNGGRMSVRRKFANLLEYFNPFFHMPPQQDEDTPARKRPRLEISSAADSVVDADADAELDTFLDAQTYRYYMTDDDTALAALPDDDLAVTADPTVVDMHTTVDAHTTETATTAALDDTVAVAVVPAYINTVTVTAAATSFRVHVRRSRPPHKWTMEEDAKLTEAIMEMGKDWVRELRSWFRVERETVVVRDG